MPSPRFPTMLRKMWSGGEVQDWLDTNVDLYAVGYWVSGPKGSILALEAEEAKAREHECGDDPDDITWTRVYIWGQRGPIDKIDRDAIPRQ